MIESFVYQNIYLSLSHINLNETMKVISHRKLVEFYQKHPESKTALETWYLQVKFSKWSGYNDLKCHFNSVDAIGNQRYVFNVKGNH